MFGVAMGGCSCHCESLYFTVKAFDPDGTERWRHDQFPAGGRSCALLLSEDNAYIAGNGAGQLQLLSSVDDDNPEVEWSSTGDAMSFPATPADAPDHNRLLLSDDSHLWALAYAGGGSSRLMLWDEDGLQVAGLSGITATSQSSRLATFDDGDTAGVTRLQFPSEQINRYDRSIASVASATPVPPPPLPGSEFTNWRFAAKAGNSWLVCEAWQYNFSSTYALHAVLLDGQTLVESDRYLVNPLFFQSIAPTFPGICGLVTSDDGSIAYFIDLHDNLVKMSLPAMAIEWSVPQSTHQLANLLLVDDDGNVYGTATGNPGSSRSTFFDVKKVDGETGSLVWSESIIATFQQRFYGLRKCGADVVVFGAWKENPGDSHHRHIAKLASADGNVEWQQSYTSAVRLLNAEDVFDVRCGDDGSVYVCGNRFKGGSPDTVP